jgi:hypothetical protein
MNSKLTRYTFGVAIFYQPSHEPKPHAESPLRVTSPLNAARAYLIALFMPRESSYVTKSRILAPDYPDRNSYHLSLNTPIFASMSNPNNTDALHVLDLPVGCERCKPK